VVIARADRAARDLAPRRHTDDLAVACLKELMLFVTLPSHAEDRLEIAEEMAPGHLAG
jgi:hypothetical protein